MRGIALVALAACMAISPAAEVRADSGEEAACSPACMDGEECMDGVCMPADDGLAAVGDAPLDEDAVDLEAGEDEEDSEEMPEMDDEEVDELEPLDGEADAPAPDVAEGPFDSDIDFDDADSPLGAPGLPEDFADGPTADTELFATGECALPPGVVPEWGQCGGKGYTGDTDCGEGFVCEFLDKYFSQCLRMVQEDVAGTWEQCGGKGYSGPTECELRSTCKMLNEYYSQCVPCE